MVRVKGVFRKLARSKKRKWGDGRNDGTYAAPHSVPGTSAYTYTAEQH